MAIEFEVWKGKGLDGLFKDIYVNQKDTQSKITVLIDTLRPLIKTSGDAAIIVPLIAEYLDVSVKNDSHLVRLAGVVQRLVAAEKLANSESAGGLLSDEEKKQLLDGIQTEVRQIAAEQTIDKKQIASAVDDIKALDIAPREDEEEDKD